jgi:putative chitinase
MITIEQLQACFPHTKADRIAYFHEGIDQTFQVFDINTPQRAAAFLAQTGHESGGLNLTEENLHYKAETLSRLWPRLFPEDVAEEYAAKGPQAIGSRAYGGRMGNGPEETGDGFRYRGRGLIQLTGKDNYAACGDALGMDLVSDPDQVSQNPVAVLSAGWFWDTHHLNSYADQGDMLTITKKINGGTIGLEERVALYNHILSVLG